MDRSGLARFINIVNLVFFPHENLPLYINLCNKVKYRKILLSIVYKTPFDKLPIHKLYGYV